MCSGGREKLANFDRIYINAPEEEAVALFEREFHRDPRHTTCSCCGPDYSIDEYDSFEAATAHEAIGAKSLVLHVERVVTP